MGGSLAKAVGRFSRTERILEGFCLARVGYSEDEAETLCAAAVEFFDFAARQKQRCLPLFDSSERVLRLNDPSRNHREGRPDE